jgi:nucleoid-associated protein YgaU
VIQSSDSFWTISQRVYGTGRYFQALYEYNRRLCPQPDRLPAGVTIETPEPYLLERAFPELFR